MRDEPRTAAALEVRGVAGLEKVAGPVFFVADHLSYLDRPSIMFALPAKIRYSSATAAWAEFFFAEHQGLMRVWKRGGGEVVKRLSSKPVMHRLALEGYTE